MNSIIRVSKFPLLCCLIVAIATIPITTSAQYIVMPPSPIYPDCHTYTGCGVIVANYYYVYHVYKPKPHKPKIHKAKHKVKRHHIYHQPCAAMASCYVPPVVNNCGYAPCGPSDYWGYEY